MSTTPEIDYTERSTCGRGRITYRPDWDANKPWICAWRGTVFQHAATQYQARALIRDHGGTIGPT